MHLRGRLIRMAKKTNGNRGVVLETEETYENSKKESQKLIRLSKKKHWEALLKDLENDVWGDDYKKASKSLRHPNPFDLPDRQKWHSTAKTLFPEKCDHSSSFIMDEISIAKMKNGKVSEPDGMEVIRQT